jgi:AAA+ ATPase superfamily predicted ATPase
MAFHNRQRELALLNDLYRRAGGQLFVLYGRRRVGKTALLTHWLEAHPYRAFYWTADRVSSTALLRSFSQAVENFIDPTQDVPPDFTYSSWELAFRQIARLADKRLVVVMDEFTYLIEADPSVTSVLQRVWDHHLKKSQVYLVLTGSHAGMIEREVLAYRSPLYNRATSTLHLQPMPFGALASFFPNYSADDRAKIYACVGGIPQYLELCDPDQSADDNLLRLISSSMIMDDAGALLRDQLGEPRNYAAVTFSIAAGYTRMSEIATMSGLQPSNVGKYLDVLQHLGIIVREVPATISRPEHSKQGRYRVVDHYLRFYYRFIAPARSNLERGLIQQAWQNMRQHLAEYVGTYVFEELCREWVLRQGDAGRLPFVPRRVGSFWASRKPQIDVVAINEDDHAILLGECKWTTDPIRKGVVESFLKSAVQIIPEPVENWKVTYALFSKSGFTAEAKQVMGQRDCLWIDLNRLDRDLREG